METAHSPAALVLAEVPHGVVPLCYVSRLLENLKSGPYNRSPHHSGSYNPRPDHSVRSVRFTPPQKRAAEIFGRARSMNMPPSELLGLPSRRRIAHDPNADPSQRSFAVSASSGDGGGQAGGADEEGGLPVATRRGTRLNMKKIAECRERSQSAWLHFPHVELVFLLFAFEGAVAAQVVAVRESASPLVVVLALSTLVSLLGFFAGVFCYYSSTGAQTRQAYGTCLAAHRYFRVGRRNSFSRATHLLLPKVARGWLSVALRIPL